MTNNLKPGKPGRTKGAYEVLIAITYKTISDWTGLSLSSCRQYASRGHFNARDLVSVLQWCNTRRASKGLPPIGQTTQKQVITCDLKEQEQIDLIKSLKCSGDVLVSMMSSVSDNIGQDATESTTHAREGKD